MTEIVTETYWPYILGLWLRKQMPHRVSVTYCNLTALFVTYYIAKHELRIIYYSFRCGKPCSMWWEHPIQTQAPRCKWDWSSNNRYHHFLLEGELWTQTKSNPDTHSSTQDYWRVSVLSWCAWYFFAKHRLFITPQYQKGRCLLCSYSLQYLQDIINDTLRKYCLLLIPCIVPAFFG